MPMAKGERVLEVRAIPVGPLSTNCYILESGGYYVVIDPGDEGERILTQMREGLAAGHRLKAVLLTHAHFDHTLAAGYLQEKTGAPVYVGRGDAGLLSNPGWMRPMMPAEVSRPADVRALSEGDILNVGAVSLVVWETPGHSPGSLTFLAEEGVPTPVVFCGDLLFRGGVGRTDLPGGDESALASSISRVLELPDETAVYPGHGPATTIGRERDDNPFV